MAEVRINISAEDRFTPVIRAIVENTRGVVGGMNAFMQGEAQAFQASWQSAGELIAGVFGVVATAVATVAAAMQTLDDSLDGLHATVKSIEEELKRGIEFKIDTDAAGEAVKGIVAEVGKLDAAKVLALDTASASAALDKITANLDSLDTTRRLNLDVSQALEGAARVRAALDSIPAITYKDVIVRYQTKASPVRPFTEGMEYIKRKMESLPTEGSYTLRVGGVERRPAFGQAAARGAGAVTFAPTININTTAGAGGGSSLAREIDMELARMWRYNRSELRRAARP